MNYCRPPFPDKEPAPTHWHCKGPCSCWCKNARRSGQTATHRQPSTSCRVEELGSASTLGTIPTAVASPSQVLRCPAHLPSVCELKLHKDLSHLEFWPVYGFKKCTFQSLQKMKKQPQAPHLQICCCLWYKFCKCFLQKSPLLYIQPQDTIIFRPCAHTSILKVKSLKGPKRFGGSCPLYIKTKITFPSLPSGLQQVLKKYEPCFRRCEGFVTDTAAGDAANNSSQNADCLGIKCDIAW